MNRCPICGELANKDNVHLIPWFLIKDCITEGGSGIRDKELSFTIDSSRPTQLYAGRSVLPEKLEDLGNLNLLPREEKNPYSRDKIICSYCEKNLSRLEAIFASEFGVKKIDAMAGRGQRVGQSEVLTSSKYNASIFELLIQSIFYRCSIGRFDGFSLPAKIENKIQTNLSKCFNEVDIENLKPEDTVPLIHRFPIIATLFNPYKGGDPTINFIRLNKSRFPFFLISGKWTFQLFEKESHIKSCIEYMHGLLLGLKPADAYKASVDKSHIFLLDKELSSKIHADIVKSGSLSKINALKKNIREVHNRIFNFKADEYIQNYIFSRYFRHLDVGKSEFDSLVHAFYDLKKLP